MKNNGEYTFELGESPEGNITRITNQITKLPQTADDISATIEILKKEFKTMEQDIQSPFKQQKELDSALKKQADILEKLSVSNNANTESDSSDIITEDMNDEFTTEQEVIEAERAVESEKEPDEPVTRSYKGNAGVSESEWTAEKSNNESNSERKSKTSGSATPKSIGEITKYISDKFGIPISTGNIGQKDSLGIFKLKPQTIRTRISNSLPVTSHEFGHYFDEKYNLYKNERIKDIINALDSDFREAYSPEELPHEAVAEFIRVYLQSKTAASKISKGFYNDFLEALKGGKELADFNQVADYINEYMTASFDDRADAAIVSGKDKKQLRIDELKRKAYMDFVDSFAPIKDVMEYVKKESGDIITGENDSYVLATNSRNASAVADYIIRNGMTDLNGNINAGKSFIDCIKDVNPKNIYMLDRYLVFKHSLEWLEPNNNGKIKRVFADDTLQNAESIRKSIANIEKTNPEIKQAAENLYEFQHSIMKNFYVDGGGMTEKMMNDLIETYPNYVPFFRSVSKNGGRVKSSFANQKVPVRRAKGSGLEIISPLESIVRNVESAVKFATRNRVMQTLAKHADNTEGIGQFMERVPPDMIARTINIIDYKTKLSERLEGKLSDDDLLSVTNMINDILGDNIAAFSPVVNAKSIL